MRGDSSCENTANEQGWYCTYCLQELISVSIIAGSVLASQYRDSLVKSCSLNGFRPLLLPVSWVASVCGEGCEARVRGKGGEREGRERGKHYGMRGRDGI